MTVAQLITFLFSGRIINSYIKISVMTYQQTKSKYGILKMSDTSKTIEYNNVTRAIHNTMPH